ncbi:transmembrane protease serine 9-like [Condylostylus longicornis]|uniref:transmembrane protease serine 9-like n=1 Tax=Condylostylus longicornis TaxID=2530218 RepID=UPI00244DC257|nr:transmembrane protease serine 9-like [Condylostylus longicornis]
MYGKSGFLLLICLFFSYLICNPNRNGSVCICVPPGSCPGLYDGSGLLDLRIMISNIVPPTTAATTVSPSNVTTAPNALFAGNCSFNLIKCCRPGRYRCGERYPPPPGSPTPITGQPLNGAYPWSAKLLLKLNEQYIAGGALIDFKHVITVAHKVSGLTPDNLIVRLGDWNSTNGTTPIPARSYNVSKIITHPNFTSVNLFNDISVLILSTPVILGSVSTIGTVCLTRERNYNSRCFVSGWGKENYAGAYSSVQRHIQVGTKPPSVCQDQFRKTKLGRTFIFNSNSFICAGGESGRDACTGDGGSPLVCEMNGRYDYLFLRWAVVGLVAWGIGCGTNNVPGAYVNVASYIPWIENKILPAEEIPKKDKFETNELERAPRQTVLTTTCICVPPGSCSTSTATPSTPTDGTGQIDIRIVTNNLTGVTVAPTNATPVTCQYGLVSCCRLGNYRCGETYPPPPNSPSSGPNQAQYGQFPWQAALLTVPGDVYIGGGALVDNRHILTAAHKVYNVPLTSLKVRLGEWNAGANNEPIPPQDYTVSRVFINPSFNSSNLYADTALLRLSSIVPLGTTTTIGTVCLTLASFVNSTCYVAGWGKNDFNGNYQAIQKFVDVTVIDSTTCQNNLRATRLGSNFILSANDFICAGGVAGKDACTGDGGSPLVCQTNDNRWVIIGMVAWGIGCGQSNVPGVYVNVANFITWIQQSVQTP